MTEPVKAPESADVDSGGLLVPIPPEDNNCDSHAFEKKPELKKPVTVMRGRLRSHDSVEAAPDFEEPPSKRRYSYCLTWFQQLLI